MIYAATRADYFPKSWTPEEYAEQFEILVNRQIYLGADENGLVAFSLIGKIIEIVKGILGWTNRTREERVQAIALKFLYYGEAHGLLDQDRMYRMQYYNRFNQPLSELISLIANHRYSKNSESGHLLALRQKIEIYHQRHVSSLQPGLWSRLGATKLDPKKLAVFGDAPLYFSQQATTGKRFDAAFVYLKQAFDVKNDDPQFQKRLADQLTQLEEQNETDQAHATDKFQRLWFELGKTAFEHEQEVAIGYFDKALRSHNLGVRLAIGKFYLENQQYERAQPFLNELQRESTKDPHTLALIGQAYLETSPSSGNLIKASECLIKAYNLNPRDFKTQEGLCQMYEKIWEQDPEGFSAVNGDNFLKAMQGVDGSILKKSENSLSKIFIHTAEKFFNAHQHQTGHAFVERALSAFPQRADVKIQVLDLATRFDDLAPLLPKLETWAKQEPRHPFLRKKIGEAYWKVNKPQEAIAHDEEALALFSSRLLRCVGEEKEECQKLMAEIEARIGHHLLAIQPGIFQGTPFERALTRLEKAVALDPSHGPAYSAACLKAAEAEKQKWRITSDKNKVIDYYKKAFVAHPEKRDYLYEMLSLCFENNRESEAAALFLLMQKQDWFKELEISAELYYLLGMQFDKEATDKNKQEALACLKEAFLQDPDDDEYKREYYQFVLNFSQTTFKNILDKSYEKEAERIKELKSLSEILQFCWDKGFDNLENSVKAEFRELLSKVYFTTSKACLKICLIPTHFGKDEKASHFQKCDKVIQQALAACESALSVDPENAMLHFEKGLILEYWTTNMNAFDSYLLAVKYQPRNPFYHWQLAVTYSVIKGNSGKYEEHKHLAEEWGYPDFSNDKLIFSKEILFKVKSKVIDPHAHTKEKKGWGIFG